MKIMGDMSSVLSAVHLVLSSNSPEEEDAEATNQTNLELRMLIPEEVVGAVIGKGGKNIKDIKHSTGATVYIKNKQTAHPDCPRFRISSIHGTDRSILQALAVLLTQLYSSSDYHEKIGVMIPFQHPMPNQMMHSRLSAAHQHSPSLSSMFSHMAKSPITRGDGMLGSNDLGGSARGSQVDSPLSHSDIARTFFEMFQSFHRLSSTSSPTSSEGFASAHAQSPFSNNRHKGFNSNGSVGGAHQHHSHLAGDASAKVGGNVGSISSDSSSNGLHQTNGLNIALSPTQGSFIDAPEVDVKTRILTVPDEVIGTLIGTKGKTINRIKGMSGAIIVISKKGDYFSGTENRKITVTGTDAQIEVAQELIIQHVSMYSIKSKQMHNQKGSGDGGTDSSEPVLANGEGVVGAES